MIQRLESESRTRFCYIRSMKFSTFFFITCACITAGLLHAQQVLPVKPKDVKEEASTEAVQDTIRDTVYVAVQDGTPWNRENFPPSRLVRKGPSFDDALKVGYTYSLSFLGGSFGTFAHQSYMAHVDYEFTPNLHLYADLGLWMPLYANFRSDVPVAKEDVRQGRVGFVLPDVALEYKPSENTYLRLMFVNERDAVKAYGPSALYCNPYRYSIFCR